MRHPWEAERTPVGSDLAKELIRRQAPSIAADRVELLGEGWDNQVYRVDERWVFRFPRRQLGADLLETECAVLPGIGDLLPLPVPVPTVLGEPTPEFDWPFAGYRYLEGRTACSAALTEEARSQVAEPLGRFVRALHAIPSDAIPDDTPGDTLGRMDLDKRIPWTEERLEYLVDRGVIDSAEPWLPLLRGLPRPERPSCLVHGDLYVRHLLVDDEDQLCGVIDWGDVHLGDPACDLMVAFSFLPPGAEPAFEQGYGPIDAETRCLSFFRALFHATAITYYGHERPDRVLLREGLRALERLRPS